MLRDLTHMCVLYIIALAVTGLIGCVSGNAEVNNGSRWRGILPAVAQSKICKPASLEGVSVLDLAVEIDTPLPISYLNEFLSRELAIQPYGFVKSPRLRADRSWEGFSSAGKGECVVFPLRRYHGNMCGAYYLVGWGLPIVLNEDKPPRNIVPVVNHTSAFDKDVGPQLSMAVVSDYAKSDQKSDKLQYGSPYRVSRDLLAERPSLWLFSSYSLTITAFLLCFCGIGRISDSRWSGVPLIVAGIAIEGLAAWMLIIL